MQVNLQHAGIILDEYYHLSGFLYMKQDATKGI